MSNDTQQRPSSARRSFLPRRSRGDRKLAGVAGGLGRAFGVDPVLVRVAFVVLAIFGGSGVLLYCLGWLLMPADGDEVSAVEALAGRGQSSVSTALTIVLIIIGLSSAGSVFSWGLPFWPVVIAAVIVFALVRHGRMGSCSRSGYSAPRGGWAGRSSDWNARSTDWGRRADEFAERAAAWGSRFGQRADEWTQRWAGGDGRRGGWSGSANRPASPFGRPAFWETADTSATPGPTAGAEADPAAAAGWAPPDPSTRQAGAPTSSDTTTTGATPTDPTATGSPSPTDVPPETPEPPETPSPEDLLTGGRTTPPTWDPLGVAPFAWDLPDPSPEPSAVSTRPDRGRGVLGRLFVGLALITGGVLTGGVFAGWWLLSWAAIAGITLSVIGAGLLLTSLRGSSGRGLIGPGIFLSLVTLALTVTGINGTANYGQQTWLPTDPATVDGRSFTWNGGQATLDLSKLKIDAGETVTTDLDVKAGQATIVVPKGVDVEATCSAQVGEVQCLGSKDHGVRPEATGHQKGDHGKLVVKVHANAGQAEVRSHG